MSDGRNPDLVHFGKAVRERRQFLRMRQKEVAGMIDIDPRTLANIEWARHWPSLPVYVKLCKALQLPAPTLFA